MSLYCVHKIKFKPHYKTFYDTVLFSFIHLHLSFFSIFHSLSKPYKHTHTHTHTPPLTYRHTLLFLSQAINTIQRLTKVPSSITLPMLISQFSTGLGYMWSVFNMRLCCSLIASNFSNKIVSSWVLSSIYFPPPQRILVYD